ncbi:TPA: hypothetical protein N0F65_011391 [Lagenidium giganteum]|uniref:Uncharacterized protein n=1 Tax=Lagenidium giganteum TaxID=4803 RepID=A0AAV2Z705_9STRA|nr:TPA: hypothetical protein N0F65_011391 [Lagenidium giganteum]
MRDHKKQNLFTAIFGVSSPLFDTLHMAREAIEVACQVNQAHWASFLVSQRYLNHVLVLILVLNAWSTPLIHCIQAVSCMAIPLLLVVPFWRDFDFQEMVIPVNLEYDDVYFARVVTEMQIVAAGTWLGLVVGIIVLAVHLSAHVFIHRFSNDQSCDLVSAPWFATKFPCLVYNFDCAVWNQTSAHSGDLAFLEPGALVTLNFVHCSALEVPNDLRMFRNIIGINLKHVTLVDWPRTTAVDPAFHPVMMFVVFSYVKLPSVPAGILGPLPAMLQDIEFSHTNLSVIPEDLGEHWRDLNTLYFEYSQIHEIPRSLMSISFNTLSLIGNYIEDASVLEWLPMSVGDVALDFNPLKIMPYRIDAADISIFRFGAQDTLVANVSDELLANVKEMFMRQTPYCDVTSIDHLLPGINCQDNLWLSTGRCQSD